MRNTATNQQSERMTIRRREILEDYIARGIETYTPVCEAWVREGIFNEDGEPFSHHTFNQDRNYIRQKWAKVLNENHEKISGDVFLKQLQVFKLAIEAGDYSSALQALKGVRELQDLDKPKGSRSIKRAADEKLVN